MYKQLDMVDRDQDAAPYEVVKTYPSRGLWRQYRLAKATPFTCNRCELQKTVKLVVIIDNKWDALLCNGCYGLLLSTLSY